MNLAYFLTFPSRTVLLSWGKNPSIVFDQGASNVWGPERLLSGNCIGEDTIFDPFSFSKPAVNLGDWESLNDHDWDILPALHAPVWSPTILKDCHFQMSAPDRSRKLSISDIIDVLNLQDEKPSVFNIKVEDYDSGHPESTSSSSSSSGCSESSSDKLSPTSIKKGNLTMPKQRQLFFSSNPGEYNDNGSNDSGEEIDVTENTEEYFVAFKDDDAHVKLAQPAVADVLLKCGDHPHKLSKRGHEDKVSIEAASSLLSSEKDAIIIILDENKKVKYMSTSRQKLENYLAAESPEVAVPSQKLTSPLKSGEEIRNITITQPVKRRGRKRVHEPDKDEEERESMKRERNNEACRKFRKSRKEKQKDLFEQESIFLQRNFNLKEQIGALNRQLNYIKEKLGLHEEKSSQDII